LNDYHLDGLRIDAAQSLIDESDRHLLTELKQEMDALAAYSRGHSGSSPNIPKPRPSR